MSAIRIACQTYTWEMLGDEWRGRVIDLLDWIADAGYAGIEITNHMIGEFAHRPADFARELRARDLQLAAFAYSTGGFADAACWDDDVAGALRAVEFLSHAALPQPRLALGSAAGPERDNARARLDQAIRFYN